MEITVERIYEYSDNALVQMLLEKKKSLQNQLYSLNVEINSISRNTRVNTSEVDHELAVWIATLPIQTSVDRVEQELRRINNALVKAKDYLPSTKFIQPAKFSDLIDKAKRVPLESIVTSGEVTRKGNKSWIRCPFHDEKTASCCIYTATNSFHCFGCKESGDTIKYVQKTRNVSFKEAVNLLSSIF